MIYLPPSQSLSNSILSQTESKAKLQPNKFELSPGKSTQSGFLCTMPGSHLMGCPKNCLPLTTMEQTASKPEVSVE